MTDDTLTIDPHRPPREPQSLGPDYAWIQDNARLYPGCWLAVRDGVLLAAEVRLRDLLAQLEAMPGGDQALLHRQPDREERT